MDGRNNYNSISDFKASLVSITPPILLNLKGYNLCVILVSINKLI